MKAPEEVKATSCVPFFEEVGMLGEFCRPCRTNPSCRERDKTDQKGKLTSVRYRAEQNLCPGSFFFWVRSITHEERARLEDTRAKNTTLLCPSFWGTSFFYSFFLAIRMDGFRCMALHVTLKRWRVWLSRSFLEKK
jgi:hypothetical protein